MNEEDKTPVHAESMAEMLASEVVRGGPRAALAMRMLENLGLTAKRKK